MRIGVSARGYRKTFQERRMDYAGLLDEAKRIGADGIEIFSTFLDPDRRREQIVEIARSAREQKMDISTLTVGNDFALPTARERANQVDRMVQAIEDASVARILRLNVFVGYHHSGQDPALERMRVIDSFVEAMPLAEKLDITLCIENHGSVIREVDGLLSIIRMVGSPNLKLDASPTNFIRSFFSRDKRAQRGILPETKKAAPMSANVHLKINTFTGGEANAVPTRQLLDIFRNVGYEGFIVLEYVGRGDPEEPNRLGVALLRKLLRDGE